MLYLIGQKRNHLTWIKALGGMRCIESVSLVGWAEHWNNALSFLVMRRDKLTLTMESIMPTHTQR